ncbi:Aldo/keto reductase [Serendipita vermifera]|nr:Aldo/keto reductase [Serendipita vermifera]
MATLLSKELSIASKVTLLSGREMPLLGLGVFQNTGSSVVPACLAGFDAGYRHIDSAQFYRNEAEVAEAMAKSGLNREDIFVTTKIMSGSSSRVPSQVASSLQKFKSHDTNDFKFQYIDLLLIHDPNCGPRGRIQMWKDFLKARDAGHVKSVGVSNFGVRHLQELVDAGLEVPSVNQIELHPFCQQKEIVKWCEDHGVVVQAYCPLIRGRRWDNPTLARLAEKHGKGVGQILVRWSLQKGFSPLPKSSQPERVKSNAALYDFTLSDEDMVALDSLDEGELGALSWNPVHAR